MSSCWDTVVGAERVFAVKVRATSGAAQAFDSVRVRVWESVNGVPTGDVVYDTDGDAATNGTAVFDETSQMVLWTLPDGGFTTAGDFLAAVYGVMANGDIQYIPTPRSRRYDYYRITSVQVGP